MGKAKKVGKKVVRKVYICGVDWQHEMDWCGVLVQPSIKALKESSKCWDECGIVELEVSVKRWVEPQDLLKGIKKRESKTKPKSTKRNA